MADLDEDAPNPPPHTTTLPDTDHDPTDEPQDFRFLTHLTHPSPTTTTNPPTHPTLPRRGEKDFEPHGTTHQTYLLHASRHAMHTALSHPRLHTPKSHVVGTLDATTGMTVVERARGQHFRTMGRADRGGRVWLLPEEAVYLCERGSLDVRWPVVGGEDGNGDGDWDGEEREKEREGVPVSLQGCYACLVGRGGLSMERYVVYAGLKRGGYVVLRAPTWGEEGEGGDVGGGVRGRVELEMGEGYWGLGLGLGLFARIFRSLVTRKSKDPPPLGPLVTPGLYRNYNDIYRLLSIIPCHDPTLPSSSESRDTTPPFRITYHVYKPSSTFKKSAPGPPDFRIAVVDGRESSVPTIAQLSALLESTPYDPPPKSMDKQVYQRLKHGYRNVILAVVDQGVVSYLRITDAGFGQERLYERFGKGGGGKRGGKGGGRGGRGRGRGRGR